MMKLLPALALALAALPSPPTAGRATTARTLAITARNYAFDVADTVSAGKTEIRLLNAGPELHHAWLLKIDRGHTFAELLQAAAKDGPPPAWVHDVGGPNAPAPGQTSVAVVDLAPGTYAVACFIPGPDGKPHVMKGMVKEITVVDPSQLKLVRPASAVRGATTGTTVSVAAPDVTIALADYAFTPSKPLAAGRHVVRVTNGATQTHELFVAKLAPGKRAQDLLAWIEKMDGPPPGLPMGGVVGIAPGASNDIVLDLTPGNYAFFCFVPDAKDGKPHVAHGMVKEFAVK